MKRLKLLALLAVFALFAAACGGSDSDDAATNDTDATEVDASEADEDEGAVDEDEDAMDEDEGAMDEDEGAMDEDEDAMDEDEDDAAPVAAASTAGEGGNLLVLQWQAPSIANAYQSTGTKDVQAGSLVVEPLAEWTPEGELVAALAADIPTPENGGVSEDLTQITWTLQEGVVWSDGTPLTASDVVFTWQYCVDDTSGCVADGFSSVVDVVADDDTTVTITFDTAQPFPYVPFVGSTMPIIQEAQFAGCLGDAALSCTEQNESPIGTGPYTVTTFLAEDTVIYDFNPLYRKASEGKPFFGQVEIKGGGDAESAARSVLEIGEADYAWNLQVPPAVLRGMVDAGNGQLLVGFGTNVEHININHANPDSDPPSDWNERGNQHPVLYENPEFARALSLAINRDELVEVGYGPTGVPTCNFWNLAGQTSTNNDWCLTQDLDAANAILDDLGYLDTDGDGVRESDTGVKLEFDYVTSTNGVRQSNQELVKSYWAAIGVEVNLLNESGSLFFDGTSDVSIWRFPTDLEMFTNGPSGPDSQGYLQNYLTEQIPESSNNWAGSNFPRYANDEYDAIFATLAETPLGPERDALTIQLNDKLHSDGALIPLILRASASASALDITGIGDVNSWDSEYWNIEDWARSE